MIFLGRLFGFMVVMVLVGAVFLNVADRLPVDGVVDLASSNLNQLTEKRIDSQFEETFDYEEIDESLPIEFRSGSTNRPITQIKVETLNKLKETIVNEQRVLVLLDNQYLKNPYLMSDQVFLVNLTGYNRTHFFSDGSEIGSNSFTYLADDLIRVLKLSGSQVWIFNK